MALPWKKNIKSNSDELRFNNAFNNFLIFPDSIPKEKYEAINKALYNKIDTELAPLNDPSCSKEEIMNAEKVLKNFSYIGAKLILKKVIQDIEDEIYDNLEVSMDDLPNLIPIVERNFRQLKINDLINKDDQKLFRIIFGFMNFKVVYFTGLNLDTTIKFYLKDVLVHDEEFKKELSELLFEKEEDLEEENISGLDSSGWEIIEEDDVKQDSIENELIDKLKQDELVISNNINENDFDINNLDLTIKLLENKSLMKSIETYGLTIEGYIKFYLMAQSINDKTSIEVMGEKIKEINNQKNNNNNKDSERDVEEQLNKLYK